MTGTIYHPVEFDVTYQNCLSDYKDNLYHKGLINHDELMALISGGMAARKAYIESHSSLLYEEIIDVSMYYNLNRSYTKDGISLDGGPDWKKPSRQSHGTSNSSSYVPKVTSRTTPTSSSHLSNPRTGSSSSSNSNKTTSPNNENDIAMAIVMNGILLLGGIVTYFIVRDDSSQFWAIVKAVFWPFLATFYICKYIWLFAVWIFSLF